MTENQIEAKLIPPRRPARPRRSQTLLELAGDLDVPPAPAQALLPQCLELTRLLGPDDGVGLEHHTLAEQLGPEGGHGVLGEGCGVDSPADALERLARDQLRAAGEARLGAEDVLRAPGRRLRGDVLEGDEPVQVRRGSLPSLMYAVTAPISGVGEVASHHPQCLTGEDHVGVDDQHRLVPALGANLLEPVVDRRGLALAARLAAEVQHRPGVLRGLAADYVRRLIGARVVDDVDAQPVGRVLEVDEPVERPPDHRPLVPGGDDDGDARVKRRQPLAEAKPVTGREDELIAADQRGDPARERHAREHPLERPHPAGAGTRFPSAARTDAQCPYRPIVSGRWLSVLNRSGTPRETNGATVRADGQLQRSSTSIRAPERRRRPRAARAARGARRPRRCRSSAGR